MVPRTALRAKVSTALVEVDPGHSMAGITDLDGIIKALITDGLLKKIVYAFISLVLALDILLFERIIRFKWRAIATHPRLCHPTNPSHRPRCRRNNAASSSQLSKLASPRHTFRRD